ncbi:MAG: deoxyribose-phosphate aldolase, partial [Acidimicrobiia bacterium]
VEPLPARRTATGAVTISRDADDLVHAIAVASGIGATSAHTWLKLPVVDDIERVVATTTLPCLLLGGDPGGDPDATYAGWQRALQIPQVHGLVVGRALLYPEDGDVRTAVKRAAQLLEGGRHD